MGREWTAGFPSVVETACGWFDVDRPRRADADSQSRAWGGHAAAASRARAADDSAV